MTEATTDATEAADSIDRPTFRGCLVCYSASWAAYGVRKARRALDGD